MDAAPPQEPISDTAQAAAFGRAIESLRHGADRLVYDPFARLFVNRRQKLLLAAMRVPAAASFLLSLNERRLPGVWGNLLCRTRFIDDQLIEGIREGTQQVVLLGSGFDSRPYRIGALRGVRVFELDRPPVLSKKRSLLESVLGRLPPNVSLIAVDFREKHWQETMKSIGFNASRQTFFVWEGVTQYLTAGAIDEVLRFVASVASGSRIVFSYIHQSVIDDRTGRAEDAAIRRWVERKGEAWISGFHPDRLAPYLTARQLIVVADVGAPEYRRQYLEPLGRRLALYGSERLVVARVAE